MISVVIVSYNVAYFLEATLYSLRQSLQDIPHEIFVVDNQSTDSSVELVRNRFPDVSLIANKENVGFARANNQAIRQAKGKYILLLNPDTICNQNTIASCIAFMEKHQKAGGLGVKMLDGSGYFLPESKRGLPTPWVSFYKIFGLGKLFPKSEKFGKYYLSHLSSEENHSIEILSGAFMFLRAEALEKAGLLDESFFMYGEDVDLSFRILKAGYENHYLAETEIIHFKGESTKRSSFNYVNQFYKAMVIFAEKHFSNPNSFLFNKMIRTGIVLRGGLSVVRRFIQALFPIVLDFGLIYLCLLFLVQWWETNFKHQPGMYPEHFTEILIPVYVAVWMLSVYVLGRYSKSLNALTILKGVLIGTLLISGVTNFFDEARFSKAILLMGGALSGIILILTRLIPHWLKTGNFYLGEHKAHRILTIGTETDFEAVQKVLKAGGQKSSAIGYVSNNAEQKQGAGFLGTIHQLEDLISSFDVTELVFSLRPEILNSVFPSIQKLKKHQLSYRFSVPGSDYIIGSGSKEMNGDYYALQEIPLLLQNHNLRLKRLLDVFMTLFFVLFTPVFFFTNRKSLKAWNNISDVLYGKFTWIGPALPSKHQIKKPVIAIAETRKEKNDLIIQKLEEMYVLQYSPAMDFKLFFQYLFNN